MVTLVLLADTRAVIIFIPSVDINVHDRPLGGKAAEDKRLETEICLNMSRETGKFLN